MSPAAHERDERGFVVESGRVVQCRAAVRVGCVDVRAALEQQLHHLQPLQRGTRQW